MKAIKDVEQYAMKCYVEKIPVNGFYVESVGRFSSEGIRISLEVRFTGFTLKFEQANPAHAYNTKGELFVDSIGLGAEGITPEKCKQLGNETIESILKEVKVTCKVIKNDLDYTNLPQN